MSGESEREEHIGTIKGANVFKIVSAAPTYPRTSYRIEIPHTEPLILSSNSYWEPRPEKKLDLWTKLVEQVGQHPRRGETGMIPVEVVKEGKPAVVSYLACTYEWTKQELADMMGIKRETASQYLRDYSSGRR